MLVSMTMWGFLYLGEEHARAKSIMMREYFIMCRFIDVQIDGCCAKP
jgi:hypothetical protein